MPLEELPLDELILPLLDMRSLSRFERTSSAFQHSDNVAWRATVQRSWGPVLKSTDLETWREVARALEMNVRPMFRYRVRSATELLHRYLPDGSDWHESLRCLLADQDLKLTERRRIVAFVCAEWQDPAVLSSFLAPFRITGATPEAALRGLLLVFPFLPIDAGAGADRVIGYFARTYVGQNARALSHLFEGSPHASEESDDGEGSDKGVGSAWERRARDAVYTLVYSIIMLNTDLHNPAIQPKISRSEYAASCRRCAPLVHLDDAYLFGIYDRLQERPLAISTSGGSVTTTVRASAEGADVESHATYSVYSSIAAPLEGGVRGASSHARQSSRSTPPNQVTIDWSVAYWNCVDFVRYLQAATRRRLVAVLRIGLGWVLSPALAVLTLLVVGLAAALHLGA
jgi:hypothetical protein